jgi:hypothetical protein
MVKLNRSKKEKVVMMEDLKDGQIGVVVDDNYPDYKGRIVQRYKNYGVPIGLRSGCGWSHAEGNTLKVRVLEKDETLTIFDNE